MTKDLEDTLNELGPEYRSVVDRLLSMPSAPGTVLSPLRPKRQALSTRHYALGTRHYFLAASLLLVVSLAIWNFTSTIFHSSFFIFHSSPSPSSAPAVYTVAYASDEFALRAILDSQQSDGSWSNDYLTMQNAAALRKANDEASQIAYKRAVRYLRTKGLGPLSDDEFQRRSARAFPAG